MPVTVWLQSLILLLAAAMTASCGQAGDAPTSAPSGESVEAEVVAADRAMAPAGTNLTYNAQKAHFDYQMNCQGCHGPNGAGSAERAVPSLDDLDRFLKLPEGREFLIRVPGMSRSPLSNADLTNLANWMMDEFGGPDGTSPFHPFDETEVARLRDNPIVDGVVEHRAKLVARLDAIPKS